MIVIIIPAKGSSNRLPNKNMAPVNGRPMIDYAIDDALASRRASAIFVSTDSDAIAAHAQSRGISVIRRPETLGGEVPIIEVYRHAIAAMPNGKEVSVVVGFQPDHPDRTVTIDASIAIFERENADVLNSTEANGTKNGAHYVLSRHFVDTGEARRKTTIVDDCTNIHHVDDISRASERLAARIGRATASDHDSTPAKRYKLELMECPVSRLRKVDATLQQVDGGLISASTTYPIRGGVPDMRMPTNQGATSYDVILPEWQPLRAQNHTKLLEAYGLSSSDIRDKVVCVAGIGQGTELAAVLAAQPREVHALEFSNFVAVLKDTFAQRHVHFCQADICNMPFQNGVFDLVISGGIIQHTRSPELAVREITRCLKPSGVLSVGNLYSFNLHNRRVTVDRAKYFFHRMPTERAMRYLKINAAIYYLLIKTGLWRLHRRFKFPFVLENCNIPGKNFAYYYDTATDYYLCEYRHMVSTAEMLDYAAQLSMKVRRTPKGYLIGANLQADARS